MPTQRELPLERAPMASEGDIWLVVGILRGRGWMTAREIAEEEAFRREYGSRSLENCMRLIRQIANDSGGDILSYPGAPGYKLKAEASDEEKGTARAKLLHQAKEMTLRAAAI